MKNKKPIEEKELDQLLNSLFLETNSSVTDELTARFVFQQEYDTSIRADKENELLRKLKQKPADPGSYLNFLIILLALSVAGVGFIIYQKKKTHTVQTLEKVKIDPNNKAEIDTANTKAKLPVIAGNDSNNSMARIMSASEHITAKAKEDSKLKSEDISVYYPHSGVGSKSSATFFKPTEQDMIFYNKVKNRMIENLWSFEKETCSLIEEGELQYRGNRLTIYPFVLSNHAVTNLEYKVFLTDLIKSGRSEDFKISVVKNETWINYNDNLLATTYFFDPRYNDFPVVNISPKAASLYCEWLEKEMNVYSQQVNSSAESMNVRLPYDSEWLFATEKGYLQMSSCEGYNTIYDVKEDIIDINYLKRAARAKKNTGKRSVADGLFLQNHYGMNENQLLQLFEKAFTYTDSVYFNKEQLFGKVAYVSEMVVQQPTGKTVVVGSCWKSKQEYSDMVREFNTASASPFVGFRVTISKNMRTSNNNF